MLAQRLRHRVDIQERTEEQDSNTGAVAEAWVSILGGTLEPAEVIAMSGREFLAAAAVQAAVTTKITIRYRADVQPAMRVVHGAALYDIQAVLPDPTMRKHLMLMCEQGVNRG